MNAPQQRWLNGVANRLFASIFLAVLFSFQFTALAQTQALPSRLGDADRDGRATVIDLQVLIRFLDGRASVPASRDQLIPTSGTNGPVPSIYIDLDDNGVIDQNDLSLLREAILGNAPLPSLPTLHITETSPANGEELVSPTRTVILRFDREIDPATLNTTNFYLIANGQRLSGRIETSSTRRFATFFPSNAFPVSTEIRIVVDGTNLRSADGWLADFSNSAIRNPQSAFTADFRTLPLFRIPGADIWGYVFDSYNTNADGSLSQRSPRDTNRVAGIPSPGGEGQGEGVPVFPLTHQRPVIGATIRVDAFPEANAVTDERGYFILTNMPAPEFFVHVDGTTASNAPPGTVYPSVGKPFHSIPGLWNCEFRSANVE